MFLKNNNIIFKIRRSKVTDYAALSCFGHANVRAFHENPNRIQNVYFCSEASQTNSVESDLGPQCLPLCLC